jgi:hypothetical protein
VSEMNLPVPSHKVEAVDYSKRLMLLYQSTWCHKPEDSNFNVLLSVEVCAVT